MYAKIVQNMRALLFSLFLFLFLGFGIGVTAAVAKLVYTFITGVWYV